MFPEADMLPHLICSRPIFIGGANAEADQHGGAPLSNGAKNYFSERENGPKSPVDLPLRLDDAAASPTTPQGQRQ
jgi:hypothetical protein